jgi:hypothetical protein
MAENTKGQNAGNRNDEINERNEGRNQSGNSEQNMGRKNVIADREESAQLDEKSSGLGRRHKDSGIATKDGVTGSDYDGQVTDR